MESRRLDWYTRLNSIDDLFTSWYSHFDTPLLVKGIPINGRASKLVSRVDVDEAILFLRKYEDLEMYWVDKSLINLKYKENNLFYQSNFFCCLGKMHHSLDDFLFNQVDGLVYSNQGFKYLDEEVTRIYNFGNCEATEVLDLIVAAIDVGLPLEKDQIQILREGPARENILNMDKTILWKYLVKEWTSPINNYSKVGYTLYQFLRSQMDLDEQLFPELSKWYPYGESIEYGLAACLTKPSELANLAIRFNIPFETSQRILDVYHLLHWKEEPNLLSLWKDALHRGVHLDKLLCLMDVEEDPVNFLQTLVEQFSNESIPMVS